MLFSSCSCYLSYLSWTLRGPLGGFRDTVHLTSLLYPGIESIEMRYLSKGLFKGYWVSIKMYYVDQQVLTIEHSLVSGICCAVSKLY